MVTFMAQTTNKMLNVEAGDGGAQDADLKIQTGRSLDSAGSVPYALLAPLLVWVALQAGVFAWSYAALTEAATPLLYMRAAGAER